MSGVLRIAVVEDDPADARLLIQLLQQFEHENPVRFDIQTFCDGRAIVGRYRAEFDVIFLDVQMRFLDGLETAHLIRNLDPDVTIVFVTHMASYAARGYEVDALSYVVKPVRYVALAPVLRRAIQRRTRRPGASVLLPTTQGTARVPVADVVYAASSGRHRIEVHAIDRAHSFSGTLRALERDLSPEAGFFRSNNCYLVNLRHVVEIRPDTCVLVGGAELAISRARRRPFLEALTDAIATAR